MTTQDDISPQDKIAALEAEVQSLYVQMAVLQQEFLKIEKAHESRIRAIYASTSWRVTHPLRRAAETLRKRKK